MDFMKLFKNLKRLFYLVVGLYFAWAFVAMIELQVWREAKEYPTILTKPLTVPFKVSGQNMDRTIKLFDQVCGKDRGLMEIDTKANGVFMRCNGGLALLPWKLNVYRLKLADGTDYKALSFL